MTEAPRRPPLWTAWGWRLIGVGLLAVILWRLGVSEVVRILVSVRQEALLLAVLLAMLLLLVRSLRWWVLCRGVQLEVSVGEALRFYLLGGFVAAATPGRVGDIVRAYYVRGRRSRGGLAAGVATVIYDRMLDVGQLVALSLGAVEVFPVVPGRWGPVLVGVGLTCFVAGSVWGPTRERLLAAPLAWALRRLPGGDGLAPAALPPGTLLLAQLLTFLGILCFVGETVVLARGLGIVHPSWWELSVLAALGALAGLLPITVFGVGTRDALFVAAAPLLSTHPEALIGLSLLLLALYAFNGVLGWAAWVLGPPSGRRIPEA